MNSAIKVLIVGGGQIGSRHLQGALKSTHRLSITIVDPSLSSLELSKSRAQSTMLGHPSSTIKYSQELPKNKNFNICIISTNANVRAKITRDLLVSCQIKHIIFEKVLFQKDTDYENISKLIDEKNIRAWVNCPHRTYFFYEEIKSTLDNRKAIEMSVSGSSWGMACNTIHYIDLFSYLVNCSDLKIVKTKFSDNILKSKRSKKFYEVNGLMEFKTGIHSLKIFCEHKENKSLNIKIKNKNIELFFNTDKGILQSNIDGLIKTKNQNFPHQSDLTEKLINNLIDKNKCGLTIYKESCKYHYLLLSVIRSHLSKILRTQLIECPIT